METYEDLKKLCKNCQSENKPECRETCPEFQAVFYDIHPIFFQGLDEDTTTKSGALKKQIMETKK